MKIIWRPNPLYTYVLLDAADLKILKLKCHVQALEEILCEPAFQLHPDRRATVDLEKLHKLLDYRVWATDEENPAAIQASIDHYYSHALRDLAPGQKHVGDCTCVPARCGKCFAEDLLEINTIKGAGKHSLYKIDGAFNGKDDGSVTINEAILKLQNYIPHAPWEGAEAHYKRWKAEATHAAQWLTTYRNLHFPEQVGHSPTPAPLPVLKG